MNKNNKAIIYAKTKGYYIDKEGNVYSFTGKKLLNTISNGYLRFSFRYEKKVCTVSIHRFVAYCKFGDKLFEPGIEVRHLDGNSLNNYWDNIAIGTRSQNSFDKSEETRIKVASEANKKYNHLKIIERRKEGVSYKQIMKEFNISSKGTISFIINSSLAA